MRRVSSMIASLNQIPELGLHKREIERTRKFRRRNRAVGSRRVQSWNWLCWIQVVSADSVCFSPNLFFMVALSKLTRNLVSSLFRSSMSNMHQLHSKRRRCNLMETIKDTLWSIDTDAIETRSRYSSFSKYTPDDEGFPRETGSLGGETSAYEGARSRRRVVHRSSDLRAHIRGRVC